MNATQIDHLAAAGGTTQNDILEAHFRARPGEWIEMPALAGVSGGYAVHSRVAELRRRGMNIENRRERKPGARTQHSFYRFVPNGSAG